jgi:hypothetical protein
MPWMRWRVVCALREVIATCTPTILFSSVDLPTFGRPTMAIVPVRKRLGAHAFSRRDLRGTCARTSSAAACSAARRVGPLPGGRDAEVVDAAFDREGLLVRLAVGALHRIARQREAPPLQHLLQRGLRILVQGQAARGLDAIAKQALDRRAHRLETAVE